MREQKKPREFWLDIATPYGDPCDFISEGKPHEHPSATNIHVVEISALTAAQERIAELEKANLELAQLTGFSKQHEEDV